MSLEHNEIARDSTEYVEIIAEVFVEAVRKATRSSMGCECGGEEITPALIECLQYVFLHGAPSIREIANGLEISLSAASQLVERLVKKELVTRREDEADRRLTKVELTDAGREVVRQMRDRRSKWFESIVSAMPEARENRLSRAGEVSPGRAGERGQHGPGVRQMRNGARRVLRGQQSEERAKSAKDREEC